ncbi:hypothetical protein [Microbacterium sp. CJ88]|uniref:hypothetical protein n=1 Tax=Microbacterium sp. CJ88 TaxID=3445672 RepID=UPI003F65EC57
MDENTENGGQSTARMPRIIANAAVLICATGAGALFGFVTQSVMMGVIAAAVFVAVCIGWMVRITRAGDHSGTDSDRALAEARRERGKYGQMDQPGTSGFGTPGI